MVFGRAVTCAFVLYYALSCQMRVKPSLETFDTTEDSVAQAHLGRCLGYPGFKSVTAIPHRSHSGGTLSPTWYQEPELGVQFVPRGALGRVLPHSPLLRAFSLTV